MGGNKNCLMNENLLKIMEQKRISKNQSIATMIAEKFLSQFFVVLENSRKLLDSEVKNSRKFVGNL